MVGIFGSGGDISSRLGGFRMHQDDRVCVRIIRHTIPHSSCLIVRRGDILGKHPFHRTIRAENILFAHAAFNDNGSLLYAWEFGRPDDRLYVWPIDENGTKLRVRLTQKAVTAR